jgi:hypothetical protein
MQEAPLHRSLGLDHTMVFSELSFVDWTVVEPVVEAAADGMVDEAFVEIVVDTPHSE